MLAVTKNSKIKLVKPMGIFDNIGEICEVMDVIDGVIYFSFGNGMHMGFMSAEELEKYFEPVVEEKRKILSDDEIGNIADENAHRIFEESEVKASVVFGNQLCMAAKLPNGIVIVEVAECDGDDEEDVAMNEDYCSASIVSRIFEFERYRLMHERAASQSEDA